MGFEFRNVEVYKLAKEFHTEIQVVIKETKPDRIIIDQLKRASLSVALNIAEGYGRFYKADKRHFYVTSRASVNECVACLDIIYDSSIPTKLIQKAEIIAKMLSGLIKAFKVT